jgi:hypothetical protein
MTKQLKNNWWQVSFFVLFIISTFIAGFTGGIFYNRLEEVQSAEPLELTSDKEDDLIPLIIFEEIENGILKGRLKGKEARIIVGKNSKDSSIYPITTPGEFSFEVTPILPMLKMLPAPSGAQFVGSSRGSKYYPLDTPNAFLLSSKNRRFFSSRAEAEAAGYSYYLD